jgi:hypothetical protein
MDTKTENALRSVARQCRAEIIAKTKGKPKPQHDPIITTILDFYAKKITALPPGRFSAKRWLSYYVRLIDSEMR